MAENERSAAQLEAETLAMLLGLHVYGQRLMPLMQAHDELTGACMTASAAVFDGEVDFVWLRNLVLSVPLWTFPDDDAERERWVVDFVRQMVADLGRRHPRHKS